ncbi:MAG: pitrilysin family protein [Bacteroidota bacterium]|nr:pitrilysin family protein [Bacteroidota bacterium]
MKLDRSKPPQPGPLTSVAFPKFITAKTVHGTPLYLVENHEQPLVSMSLYLRSGSINDVPGKEGLASLAAELLTKGTVSRSATQIAEEIDFVGGSLGASASSDSTTISTSVLTRYLSTALDLLADVTLNPVYANEELDRAKLQRIAGIKQSKSDPGYLSEGIFSKRVFAGHPYGLESNGTEESIPKLDASILKDFYFNISSPSDAFFVVAGDISESEILGMLNERFARWNNFPVQSPNIALPSVGQKREVILVEKAQAVQSAIRVGHLGIARNDPDYIACYVLNMLLGGYFNSRINLNLREKHGFTYGARSFFDARKQTGAFAVSTEVRTEVTARAVEEIINELTLIRKEPVSTDELSMVKNYIIGSFPLSIETPQQVAGRIATLALYGLESNYYDKFRDTVAALTQEDLLRVAETYIHPDSVTISASGDANALKKDMVAFGNVEVFDHNFEKL